MCHNSCAYCGFKRNPDNQDSYILSPEDVEGILLRGVRSGCTEALFTFGEKPETVKGIKRVQKQRCPRCGKYH